MYEQWIAMEQFYYEYFAWGLLVVIILSILLVSCLYYVNLLIPKIILILTIIAFTLFGLGAVGGYSQYGDLIEQASKETAAIRDFKRTFFMIDMPYQAMEMKAYRDGYFDEGFEAVGFYEKMFVSEPVEYLGATQQGGYVFRIGGREYVVSQAWVRFSDEVDQAVRVGTQYQVADPRFVDIGFVKKSRVLLDEYVIPSQAENRMADKEIANAAQLQARELVKGWVVQ
ncbi:hypothetical protein [Ruoffia tabacinasalis]|uniref:Uncharacterized protein n=1 Tax=Ruoffia tabacinasalis TaxID=87458 RepID=A0ABS0LJV1_9LACT|nr:hypothetical protein [Ruoffia tabacinasalis]MBG9978556.1 hypothetical protein [Ruoffia tabacinasalis]